MVINMQNKKFKGSILVATMLVVGMMLVAAISISITSLKERKASIGADDSNQAYQNADSGIEYMMDAILAAIRNDPATKVEALPGMRCPGDAQFASINYRVELKKDDGAGAEISAECTDELTKIVAIKSIGDDGQTQRAMRANLGACGAYSIDGITYGTLIAEDGKCWFDKNLGAKRVATSYDDQDSYGWLFQWGRAADGHQFTDWGDGQSGAGLSGTTSELSDSFDPGHSNFITNSTPQASNRCGMSVPGYTTLDWFTGSARDIGGNGCVGDIKDLWEYEKRNNPCPADFHVATEADFTNLFDKIGPTGLGPQAVFESSKLHLPAAGMRKAPDGVVDNAGENGLYWTGSMETNGLRFGPGFVDFQFNASGSSNAVGASVRCIHD